MVVFQNAVSDTEELLRRHHATVKGPTPFNPEAIPARRRFLARRVKLLKNLLRWRKFTGEQYGIGLLITRLVDDCMLGIAENGWDVGGEEVVRSVSAVASNDDYWLLVNRHHPGRKYLTQGSVDSSAAAEDEAFLTPLCSLCIPYCIITTITKT